MSDSELTEGLKKKEALLDYRQPLSQSALRRIASSPAGEHFGVHHSKLPLHFSASL